MAQYRQALDYCRMGWDEECISLLLHAFGEGSGWGIYQLAGEALWHFSPVLVVPYLVQALKSTHRSIRYWSADVASVFPHPDLIPPLQSMLSDADVESRFAAVGALAFIDDIRVDALLEDAWCQEQDEQLCDLLNDVLNNRRHQI